MGSGSVCGSCLHGTQLGWPGREGAGTSESPAAVRVKAWGPGGKTQTAAGPQHGFISWTILHGMWCCSAFFNHKQASANTECGEWHCSSAAQGLEVAVHGACIDSQMPKADLSWA